MAKKEEAQAAEFQPDEVPMASKLAAAAVEEGVTGWTEEELAAQAEKRGRVPAEPAAAKAEEK